MRRLLARHAWWVLGLALVVAGLALVLTAPLGPSDFGWFAYTPLDVPGDPDWSMSWPDAGTGGDGAWWVVTPRHLVGAGVLVVGVLLLAAGAAYRLGRRRGAAGA